MAQAGYTPIQLYLSTTASAVPSAGNLANGELAVNITDGKLFYKDNGGVVRVLATAAGSAGDVVGPGSSTDNALVRFDGTTGKLVQSSVGVLSDAGVLTGLTGLTSSGSITFSGLTSGRVTYAGTGGLLQDSANLTFDGTTLTANALTVSNAVTLSGGTANGVPYLNGSKVLTTGSALTFDGTLLTQTVTDAVISTKWAAATGKVRLRPYADATIGAIFESINAAESAYLPISVFGSTVNFSGDSAIVSKIGGSEQMRLTSTGLGIGTSSPGYKLDVNGQARLGGSTGLVFGVGTAFAGGQAEVYSTSTTPMGLGTTGAAVLRIYTNSTLQATFDSSGNLGLGISSPARRLEVSGAGSGETYQLRLGAGNSNTSFTYDIGRSTVDGLFRFYGNQTGFTGYIFGGVDGERARIDSSGNLLVGTTSAAGAERLNVTGSVANNITRFINTNASPYGPLVQYGSGVDPNNTTNELIECRTNLTTLRFGVRSNGGIANYQANNVNLSDRNEKTNFGPAKSYLDAICAIPVQTFNYIDQNMEEDPGTTLGVVAQDVQAVAPELVMESNWGTKDAPKMRLSIYQTDLQYALMKCIQEQQALITALTARVAALESN